MGSPLAQLAVRIPAGIDLSEDDVEITDADGEPIDATVSMSDGRAIIAFAQPVSPETTVDLMFNNIDGPLYTSEWALSVYGTSEGVAPELLIGIARIRTF